MNIEDVIEAVAVAPLALGTVQAMMEMRRKTFLGFARIEEVQGFVKPSVSFSTSHGQEMLRILLFRCIEELGEADMSVDEKHYKEELIDSVNYLLSAVMLDPTIFTPSEVAAFVYEAARTGMFEGQRISEGNFWAMTRILSGKIGDSLRNRAWMSSPQDSYFAGRGEIVDALMFVLGHIFWAFRGWEEFYSYFIAKDVVLQFRLKSAY